MRGTQKLVEDMRRPILNHAGPSKAIYQPFICSGTTLIAAESVGRICLGVELDPAHLDVGARQWKAFTGRDTVLAGSRAHGGPLRRPRLLLT